MKRNRFKTKKFWLRFTGIILLLPILVFAILLLVIYWKQDAIVQSSIESMNEHHKGLLTIGDIHLAPFENFPDISIKIDDVHIYEEKAAEHPILDVRDIYIGFNLWDMISGNYDLHSLLVEDGFFNIVIHEDGSTNLQNALAAPNDQVEEDPVHFHLQRIELRNLDIHKLNESNMMDVETYIYEADGGFETNEDEIAMHIDTRFELNVIDNGDTTFIKHKHFEFHTDLVLNQQSGMMAIAPSGIVMEHGDFEIEGIVDTKNDVNMDVQIRGTKPNFDMLIAFAPEDIIPLLEQYRNAGKIYFNSTIKGPTSGDNIPLIEANFGASEAFLENTEKNRILNDMGFEGHFSNGENRDLTTMEFSMKDIRAKPEKGNIIGSVFVKNFEEPEVDMSFQADFDLNFVADFLNLDDLEVAEGEVHLEMKFHDIIDLDNPERALKDLNQAYFSKLEIDDLKLKSKDLPIPIEHLDVKLEMDGKQATLDKFEAIIYNSDLSVQGYVSDLPAIVHHTNIPVKTHLEVESKNLDLAELTKYDQGDSSSIDEQIKDLKMSFSFLSTAKAFTESEYLPIGEFFIDDLHAQLTHYPHELHDFHADILIDDQDLTIKDFTGHIDVSDFHFNGLIHDYGFWFKDQLDGDVNLDISLTSEALHLEDVFTYKGENYVPEEYRHEEFDQLALHVNSAMHFKNHELHSIDMDLDQLNCTVKLHPMRFENFNGRFHYEDDHIVIENLHGQMGRSVFDVDMNYYLGEDDAIRKRDNHLGFIANYIDFDQLSNYNLGPADNQKQQDWSSGNKLEDVEEHAEAFNLYELPFTDMTFDVDIGHFIYHRIDLQKIHARMRTTKNHYLYLDTLSMLAAGGSFKGSGYFNGSDPKHIYLKPNLKVKDANIDKLMFKFENFGQDELVSENLHGKLSAHITGNIRMYPDMVPDLDQSEVHMDIEVTNGRLDNYEPMLLLSDYMGDKNLNSVRFDTLKNHMDITNGVMTIPNMTIESTIGHYEISGEQDMELNFDYYLRIPWGTVKEAARYRLFGNKKTAKGETGDDQIIEDDPKRRTRFLNVRMKGDIDDYDISLKKQKGLPKK